LSINPPVEWFASGRIAPEKLENYLLSPTHPLGRHKARLWKSVFGLELGDCSVLERLIREQLGQGTPERKAGGGVARRWEIVIPRFRGPNGNEHPVLTAWALEPGADHPHLTPAFPEI
jgi:hypothetical protein